MKMSVSTIWLSTLAIAGAQPQQADALARLQPAEDGDVEEGRNAVGEDPAEPDARRSAHDRLEGRQPRRVHLAARREARARPGSAAARRAAARSRTAPAGWRSRGRAARRPSSTSRPAAGRRRCPPRPRAGRARPACCRARRRCRPCRRRRSTKSEEGARDARRRLRPDFGCHGARRNGFARRRNRR